MRYVTVKLDSIFHTMLVSVIQAYLARRTIIRGSGLNARGLWMHARIELSISLIDDGIDIMMTFNGRHVWICTRGVHSGEVDNAFTEIGKPTLNS